MAQTKAAQAEKLAEDFQIAAAVTSVKEDRRIDQIERIAAEHFVTTKRVWAVCRKFAIKVPKAKPEPKAKAPKAKAPKVKKPASPPKPKLKPKPKPEAVKPPTSNGSGVKRMTREERKARRKAIAGEILKMKPEARRANLKEICEKHGVSDKVGLAACKEFDVALPKRTDGIPHRSFAILAHHLRRKSDNLTAIAQAAGVKRQRVHAVLKAAKDAKIPGVKLPRD